MPRTRRVQNTLIAFAAAAVCGAVGLLAVKAHTRSDRVAQSEHAQSYIEEAEKKWVAAVVSGDTSIVEQALADDFVGVGPDGQSFGKPTMIQLIKAAPQEYIRNHLNSMTVKVFDESAVVTGSESWERRTEMPKTGRFVWHNSWVKRDGRWQIVAGTFFELPATTVD